jgi:hypothetical protein
MGDDSVFIPGKFDRDFLGLVLVSELGRGGISFVVFQ